MSDSVSVQACGGACWRMSACAVDVAGYLEENLELAVVRLHAVVFY